jgi:hypothetical protein
MMIKGMVRDSVDVLRRMIAYLDARQMQCDG